MRYAVIASVVVRTGKKQAKPSAKPPISQALLSCPLCTTYTSSHLHLSSVASKDHPECLLYWRIARRRFSSCSSAVALALLTRNLLNGSEPRSMLTSESRIYCRTIDHLIAHVFSIVHLQRLEANANGSMTPSTFLSLAHGRLSIIPTAPQLMCFRTVRFRRLEANANGRITTSASFEIWLMATCHSSPLRCQRTHHRTRV